MRQPGVMLAALEDLPRLAIGTWPTPVRRLEEASRAAGPDIWVKSEEQCGAWGGNKVRKLEHLLHAARADGIGSLVSWGAGSSNWAAALALHGRNAGFEVTLGLGGSIPDDYVALYSKVGARVTALPRLTLAPVAFARALLGAPRPARFLPVGGSGTIGDVGAARAGVEIADAVAAGELPEPAHIFVATGTTGTAAGIAVGLGLARRNIEVVAVKVSDWPYATPTLLNKRRKGLSSTLSELLGIDVVSAPIWLETRYLGPGYSKPTPESRLAIELAARDDLYLDPTYGAKAFAALLDAARSTSGPLLFVATSPTRPVSL